MKKLVLVLVAMFPLLCFSQNIIVANGNNSNTSNNQDQEECPYRINGICSTEDIGGVDIRFEYVKDGVITTSSNDYVHLVLENYNNFTVSVLVEYTTQYSGPYIENYVLKAGETKMREAQVRDGYKSGYYLNGFIVRSLSGASTN